MAGLRDEYIFIYGYIHVRTWLLTLPGLRDLNVFVVAVGLNIFGCGARPFMEKKC